MLMPSIFGESLLDDFFGVPKESYLRTSNNSSGLMQTDIEESETGYALTMNLPGFKKEDVKAELKDGYLTINASTNSSKEEKDEKGKYIRKERYSGSCSRSFYVGEAVTQEDIKAKFEDGTLKISVPKKELKPEVEEAKYISIEG
jgi:HSP20 family molecular chaperone IbpA